MLNYYAVIGNPISHSLSPLMHNYVFKKLNEKSTYIRYLLNNTNNLKEKFKSLALKGANITLPYKEDFALICDELIGLAKDIEAVNTVVFSKNKLLGYNTDAKGFYKSIEEFMPFKKALILGAGGSAKAISFILRENNIDVSILNRTKERLQYFKKRAFKTYTTFEIKDFSYDIVINTTLAGLNEETFPSDKELLKSIFKYAKFCVDIIYDKETPFLKLAKDFNLKIKKGNDMLLYQAVLANMIFLNYKYDFKITHKYLKQGLELIY